MSVSPDDDIVGTGHRPVMADEVVRELVIDPDGIYFDATVGGGGHAELILEHLNIAGRLTAVDRDPRAVAHAGQRLARFGERVVIRHADYRTLADVLLATGAGALSGVFFDLGLCSLQLDDPARGFAYRFDGPLDLRFDTTRGQTASEWLMAAGEKHIAAALRDYGEEQHAARLARRIVDARDRRGEPITTTGQLTDLIARVTGPHGPRFGRTAARVFQALRIVVNDELAAIPAALDTALSHLGPGGRLVVIAYHSLEDRAVKTFFVEASRVCSCPACIPQCICGANTRGRLVHKRVLRPTPQEIARNPRSKAARMRVLERVHETATKP